MDIRKFFETLKRKKPEERSESDSSDSDGQTSHKKGTTTADSNLQNFDKITSSVTSASARSCNSSVTSPKPSCSKDLDDEVDVDSTIDDSNENDVGRFVGRVATLSTERKKELLENCWIPPKQYDFAQDAQHQHLKRKFNHSWLQMYSPWLAYSRQQKGAFCKFCTLFPPNLSSVRGVLGSFIIRPFCKFKDIHEYCRKHADTHFHKTALEAARLFLANMPVDVQINKYSQESLEKNRKIIRSIISCIAFCGSQDLALRGANYGDGILEGLYKMRIDAGDTTLKNHLECGKKNASYRSVDIQNQIISICGDVIKAAIIKNVKKSEAYSILADETADISGKEQLSVGIRYFDEETRNIEEVFLGFAELTALDAKSIATAIDEFLTKEDLDPDKCVGLGFDGCSTMSGKEGGVQAILRKKYNKALFFHCSSHKLNLVINDLNALPDIRNTVGTIKDIITFFRESVLRRKLVANIAKLCETRWSEKYKSIRVFKENFCAIMEALETLSRDGNNATRKRAYQLHAAASKVSFVFSLVLIAKYSALLEPTVNVLQSVSLDAVQASQHIGRILNLIKNHREQPEKVTEEIFRDATTIAEKIGLAEDMNSIPRTAERQQHRSNHTAKSPSEFWRRSITIPYLDSIINSLQIRFSEENRPSFTLTKLHPAQMKNISLEELEEGCEEFKNFYGLTNIKNEIELWKKIWEEKPESIKLSMSVVEILKETEDFFPEIKKALKILVALPCTTCTVERSFSSLRRIKTWLRSTMSEARLNGLAMMSVHRQHIFKNLNDFVNKVTNEFAKNPRRLCFN